MKSWFSLIGLFCVVAFISACGDDDSSFAVRTGDEKPRSSSSAVGYNENISYGELTDARDGKTYRTVKIGDQTWMAENLALELVESYCYGSIYKNCTRYGHLYPWNIAIGRAECEEVSCSLPPVMRGVCPDGWHLPAVEEFETLLEFVGDSSGTYLKSTDENEWLESRGMKSAGTDVFGFTALPAGYREADEFTTSNYDATQFWSSTQDDEYHSMALHISQHYQANIWDTPKRNSYSVRCIQDSKEFAPEADEEFDYQSFAEYTFADHELGTMTDSRDGQTYKTLTIGSQTWMAENLNYRYTQKLASGDSSSFCLHNSLDSCARYGRLYTWSAAMDSAAIFSEDAKDCGDSMICGWKEKVRGVCPEGWHLPDSTEWAEFALTVGNFSKAGHLLKSTSGWADDGNGIDAYGFNVLPASQGIGDWVRNHARSGEFTGFWSSTSEPPLTYTSFTNNRTAYVACFYSSSADLDLRTYMRNGGFSVRCLKN